ncbi:MAG: hypothetical protein JO112_07985 [Planctomycetes bacterium]|nr:hypothetical protein [Planctomycetota bacterium]
MDPTQADIDTLLNVQPLRCPGCQTVLGIDRGNELLVFTVRFRQPTSLECIKCGAAVSWQPGGKVGAKQPPRSGG